VACKSVCFAISKAGFWAKENLTANKNEKQKEIEYL
jgi:hypothetical protein